MQFKVREGFVVTIQTAIKGPDGKTLIQENSFFSGQVVDLTAEQAQGHLHKLEAQDKVAQKFLDGVVRAIAAPAASVPMDQVQAMVNAAVAEALAKTKQSAA